MSQIQPPVCSTGRVQSMKSRFENLCINSIEPLDISTNTTNTVAGQLITTTQTTKKPINLPNGFQFRRASTSFDFIKSNINKNHNKKQTIILPQVKTTIRNEENSRLMIRRPTTLNTTGDLFKNYIENRRNVNNNNNNNTGNEMVVAKALKTTTSTTKTQPPPPTKLLSLANQNKIIQSKEQICAIASTNTTISTTVATVTATPTTTTTTSTSQLLLNIKPTLSEIKENVEQLNDDLNIINNKTTNFILNKPSRLVRHTSDPIKRGSIKRSPAFRVGDKPNLIKTNSQNRSKLSTSSSSSPSSSPPPPPIPPLPIYHQNDQSHQHNHHHHEPQSTISSDIISNKQLATSIVPEEFAERVENLLKHSTSSMNQCDNPNDKNNPNDNHQQDEINQLYQPGITDTLKAALKQPLPTGPPPKKPPRAFLDSPSPKENISPLKLFENKLTEEKKQQNGSGGDGINDTNQITQQKLSLSTNPLKSKIDFLEQNLRIKEKITNPQKIIQKSNKINSSGIFGCIPLCTSAPIYDTVQIYKDEHIYMEPYAHLKSLPLVATVNSVLSNHNHNNNNSMNESTSESSRMDSLCSNCSYSDSGGGGGGGGVSSNSFSGNGNHITTETNIGDLHYLCTSIDSSIKSEKNETKTINSSTLDDGNNINDLQQISLTNTYDEINILVNAAFNEKLISNMTSNISIVNNKTNAINSRGEVVTNANSINNGTTVGSSVSSSTAVTDEFGYIYDKNIVNVNDDNDDDDDENTVGIISTKLTQKINPKLSRSLTEKRKIYVQRIASKNSSANLVSSYGTLYRTFKSPVIKTFSQNIDDRGDKDDNGDYVGYVSDNNLATDSFLSLTNNITTEISESTTERIKKYKKLVETTNNKLVQRDQQQQQNSTIQGMQEKREMSIGKSKSNAETDNKTEKESNLFQLCLLIGFNSSTGTSYIKSKFPNNYDVPQNIEQLVFPSSRFVSQQYANNQDYILTLTDDNGNRIYGYCRRVLPETCDVCLPLAYCIISKKKAAGFYLKLLKEIESRHGQTDIQLEYLLQQLQTQLIPEPGKFLHLKLPNSLRPKTILMPNHNANKRLSLDANPTWITESAALAAFSDLDSNGSGGVNGGSSGCNNNSTSNQKSANKKSTSNNGLKSLVQEFEEKKQQMSSAAASSSSSATAAAASTSSTLPPETPPFDLDLINRSILNRAGNNCGLSSSSSGSSKIDEILIIRPNDLRLESTELNDLYRGLGAEQLINVFGSLLLERKVILLSKNISLLSSCIFGLQTILYPFQWQYSLVSVLPQNLSEICEAPFPILIGILDDIDVQLEDAIMIDLDTKRVKQFCGDEITILPSTLRDSLLVSLEMVDILDQGKMLSSVLIAEAFLRFFVELFIGLKNPNEFEKEKFIQSHPDQSVQLFLVWFVETSMFRHFMNEKYSIDIASNMSKDDKTITSNTPNTTSQAQLNHNHQQYALFDARLLEKSENKTKPNQNIEMIMKNCKIINKKAKTLKDRFKHFLHS